LIKNDKNNNDNKYYNYNITDILVIESKLSMEDINARINQEICHEILEELTDAKLMCEYKDCNSVKKIKN